MLVSIAILFGTISVCVSTVMVYSAVIVATRAQDSMKNLPAQSVSELRYDGHFGQYEQAPVMAAAS